jgi:catechol 2,3-dioxygenase-like lactoylglutathione lyase family enzyme
VDFYQGLFGMPIQARQGETVILRMGSGPQFVAIGPTSQPPRISQMGLAVENFNPDAIQKVLLQHGLTRALPPDAPMKFSVVTREGAQEIFMRDPDGLAVQLQDASYCGGSGPLGATCKVEPSPKKGLLTVKDISHFTNSVSDAGKANQFYQDLFGLHVRSKQGASLGLGVGPGIGFVMFTGGGGARGAAPAAPRPASINHVCMNLDNFNVDAILKTLGSYGISPRGDNPPPGPTGPMKSYISMRMPNRGGAEGGTPELYFTDPDGLLIQLQDVTYCGGGGYLGNQQCV